jgi:flagellar protein FliS
LAIDARLAYIENEILQADPMRLVQMLYRGAIAAVGQARGHLRDGEIRQRSEQITRAAEIINELTLSLDREKGGEIAGNLAELYDYIQRRLQDANFRQQEQPLVEVERLLTTLLEAWEKCSPVAAPAPAAPAPAPGLKPPPPPADDAPAYSPRRLAAQYY